MTRSRKWPTWLVSICVFVLCQGDLPALGAPPPSQGTSSLMPSLPGSNESLSWSILVLLTLLTLIPALLLALTPFARILVVFHFLRQAIGTQSTPTNQTLIGLALFLTYFVTVLTVDPQLAEQIQQALDPQASAHRPLAAQTSFLRRVLDGLRGFMGEQVSVACPTLICTSPARFHLRRLLEPFLPKLAVLSPAEIPTTIEIQSMGVVS